MVKYFMSRPIYFHVSEVSENLKPESEMSSHNTLTSVISS